MSFRFLSSSSPLLSLKKKMNNQLAPVSNTNMRTRSKDYDKSTTTSRPGKAKETSGAKSPLKSPLSECDKIGQAPLPHSYRGRL